MIDDIFFYSFAAVVAIQFAFYLFLFLRIIFYQNDKSEQPQLPVSVIICVHDELENLRELVSSLLLQNYDEYEIIIVEDRCNDDTYDFLLEQTSKNPKVRMVRVQHLPEGVNSKKYALTLGIKAAKYDQILLTDADCRPATNDWIKEMQKGFSKDKQIILGFSPYKKAPGFLNLMIRFETIYTGIQYISFALAGLPYMGVGRNLAYSKSLFLTTKGFNNHLKVMGGDDDLFVNENATANNTIVNISPEAKVYSFPKLTWKEWRVQKKRHLTVGKRYKFKFKLLLGILSFSQIFFWIFFILSLTQPFWIFPTLGLFFAKVIGMVVIYAVITNKLKEKLPVALLPVLDFLYSIYFVIIGASALFSKKNKWK